MNFTAPIASTTIILLATVSLATAQTQQIPAPSATPATSAPAPAVDATAAAAEPEKTAQEVANSKMQEAISKLPIEKAKLFDNTLRGNLEKNKMKQKTLREYNAAIRENFIGGQFNKAELLAKSEAARNLQTEIRASLDADLATIAEGFTQEERQLIFNALPARYTRDLTAK